MIDNLANARAAYAGQLILTSGHAASMDSWATGLNNNVLVLGCSGSGKTRNFLKPNLLQCEGSYIVLDSKGRLYDEMAPFLRAHGYVVDRLDFTTMDGEIGYDPLHHVRWRKGRPLAQDIIAIASALFPRADMGDDPFWAGAAANYVASYIAYVFEALPDREWNMASVVSVYEQACEGNAEALFADLSKQAPDSYAASLFRRARSTARADKMHSSIMGIIAANLLPLTFDGALASFRKVQQIDFCDLGRERRALFVTMDDMDRSLAPLTSLFIRQAFSSLCDFADTRCDGGRLPVPVRFMLDDFANLTLPGFDDVLSVIRSREVSCTIICQTVSQLEARYDQAVANSIIGNCDRHLVLGFQDERTAKYFALRANKLPSTLLETPAGNWWLFERSRRGICEPAYALEQHPRYRGLSRVARCPEIGKRLRIARRPQPGRWLRSKRHRSSQSVSTCTNGDLDQRAEADDEIWVDTLFDTDNLDSDSALQPKKGTKMSEMNVRKSLSEQIARASSNKTSEHASQSEAADRKSLSERIAQANAARIDGAWSTPDEQLVEAERRTPFQICDVYCAHAEELLAITGQISAALPSRAAYLARTNPRAATHPDNRSIRRIPRSGTPRAPSSGRSATTRKARWPSRRTRNTPRPLTPRTR